MGGSRTKNKSVRRDIIKCSSSMLQKLPIELILMIGECSSPKSHVNLAQTCRFFWSVMTPRAIERLKYSTMRLSDQWTPDAEYLLKAAPYTENVYLELNVYPPDRNSSDWPLKETQYKTILDLILEDQLVPNLHKLPKDLFRGYEIFCLPKLRFIVASMLWELHNYSIQPLLRFLDSGVKYKAMDKLTHIIIKQSSSSLFRFSRIFLIPSLRCLQVDDHTWSDNDDYVPLGNMIPPASSKLKVLQITSSAMSSMSWTRILNWFEGLEVFGFDSKCSQFTRKYDPQGIIAALCKYHSHSLTSLRLNSRCYGNKCDTIPWIPVKSLPKLKYLSAGYQDIMPKFQTITDFNSMEAIPFIDVLPSNLEVFRYENHTRLFLPYHGYSSQKKETRGLCEYFNDPSTRLGCLSLLHQDASLLAAKKKGIPIVPWRDQDSFWPWNDGERTYKFY